MPDLAPAEQEKVAEVGVQAQTLVEQAHTLEVRTPEEASTATAFLAAIAKAKRESESARKTLTKPLSEHVKMINDGFKQRTVPLDEADRIVREKVLAYQQEAEKRARAEQERIERERREAEAKAEAERKAAVEAQQKAEREAREAEEKRAAERSAAQNARRAEIAEMGDDDLAKLIAAGDNGRCITEEMHDDMLMAAQEVRVREDRAERERAAEEARQREIAAKSAPATAVAAPAALASTSGSASTRKRWVAKVVSFEEVPRAYLIVDQVKLNAAVRAGIREIPGVEIEQETGLAVRAR